MISGWSKAAHGTGTMYLRFVLPTKNPHTGIADGVFEVAYDIRDSGALCEHEQQELEGLLRWFDDNLRDPIRFNRTKSKGWYRRNTKGASWFKSSAKRHMVRMHRLAEILRNHGHHVSMIKASNPGYIIYEDPHQVVAEPFNDLRS